MKKYGRIENNKVAEVFDLHQHHPTRNSLEGVFPPSMYWLEAPDDVEERWPVYNGQIVRPDYYEVLRAAAYPPSTNLIDGLVKASSTDPTTKAAGEAQVAEYYAACLAVKELYPKPV